MSGTIYYKADQEELYYRVEQASVNYKGKTMQMHHVRGLPNGMGMAIVNGEIAMVDDIDQFSSMDKCKNYTPLIQREVSLHSCIGGKDNISFDLTSAIPIDLKKLKRKCFVESAPLPLHNDYVLWCYALRITRENDDDFSLSLVSKGSHLGNAEKRGLANGLPGLTAPPIVHLKLSLLQKDQSPIELNLLPSNDDGFSVERQLSLHELIPLTVPDGLHFSLRVIVPRSYFSIDSLIDLTPPTVSVGVKNTVEAILRGAKKPDGCDWEITGAHDCSCCNEDSPVPVYSVNKAILIAACPSLKKDPTAKRGLLKGLNGSGLRIAVHIAYGSEVPLPERNDYAFHIIDRLHSLFGDHFTSVVIPQWERTICSKALALNKRRLSSSLPELLHLLNIIWSAPYGWFPVAKRVTIGVLADMAHIHTSTSVQQWVKNTMLTHLGASLCEGENVGGILTAFYKEINSLSAVEKSASE